MHTAAFDWVRRQVFTHGPFADVVEFGSLDINGSVRVLFEPAKYTGIDLQEGPGVDVLADVTEVGALDADCVVCCEVLEHSETPDQIVKAAAYALRPGGVLILTCAGPDRSPHSVVDGGPLRPGEWYCNPTPAELRSWLAEAFVDYEIIENIAARDLYAAAHKAERASKSRRRVA